MTGWEAFLEFAAVVYWTLVVFGAVALFVLFVLGAVVRPVEKWAQRRNREWTRGDER